MRTVRFGAATALALVCFTAQPALARKKPQTTWSVSRVSDPVTESETCVVAAFDRGAGLRFSRSGYLYPIVERHPVHGLLVGVSSGGRFRLPTGDILWRVDDHPYRTLKAADNPPTSASSFTIPDLPAGDDASSQAVRDTVANAMQLASGMAATSTVASGDTARAMLAEMLVGQSLIFRASAAVPDYGLPSARTYEVGQITGKGFRPFPLDESLRAGFAACGIDAEMGAGAAHDAQDEPAAESP